MCLVPSRVCESNTFGCQVLRQCFHPAGKPHRINADCSVCWMENKRGQANRTRRIETWVADFAESTLRFCDSHCAMYISSKICHPHHFATHHISRATVRVLPERLTIQQSSRLINSYPASHKPRSTKASAMAFHSNGTTSHHQGNNDTTTMVQQENDGTDGFSLMPEIHTRSLTGGIT